MKALNTVDTDQNDDKSSNSYNHLAAALCKFQFNCPAIPKKKSGYGYKYAELSDIVEIVSPHLKDAGLSYVQLTRTEQDNDVINVETVLFHESGQHISSTIGASIKSNVTIGKTGKPSMTNIQQMGALITYLRRYGLSSMIGVVTEEDTDGSTMSASRREHQQHQTNHSNNYKSQAYNDVRPTAKIKEKPLIDPQREADAIAKLQESIDLEELKANYSGLDRDIALSQQVKKMKDDMKTKLIKEA